MKRGAVFLKTERGETQAVAAYRGTRQLGMPAFGAEQAFPAPLATVRFPPQADLFCRAEAEGAQAEVKAPF